MKKPLVPAVCIDNYPESKSSLVALPGYKSPITTMAEHLEA